jgi:hypothetical protein
MARKTYKVATGDKTVRVTVPAGDEGPVLKDLLCDNLSPQAVAAIATYLLAGKTANKKVEREVAWFANFLVTGVLGGQEALERLATEAGLGSWTAARKVLAR